MSEVVSLLGDWMSFVAVSLLALGGEGGGVVARSEGRGAGSRFVVTLRAAPPAQG